MAWSTVSRHKRGYGSAWDKLRKIVMERDQRLCQCDECQGGRLRVVAAQEVDHIIPKAKGGTDDLGNLRAVSSDCHKRITAQQNTTKPRINRIIGADGWPVE